MQIKLGEQMRVLRRRDTRTQEDLAKALGVTSQAVSRWEKGICYPDMELIPSMANFFGISIDELFGYSNERSKKVDALINRINELECQNNGIDVCTDECICLAREGMAEFPGNEKIMFCLASVLYNAGYVRCGEHHMTDEEGYDVFDTECHRKYAEWKEAIKLYEILLTTLEEGNMRHQTVEKLIQLYVNTGEYEKAIAIADTAPGLSNCREFLHLHTCDGEKATEVYGETLMTMIEACSDLMTSCVMKNDRNINSHDAVQAVRNAINMFDLVCTDGNYGLFHRNLSRLYLYLSEHLWLSGDHDGAFSALDTALENAKKYETIRKKGFAAYTAPLIKNVTIKSDPCQEMSVAASLSEDWPWWCSPDCSIVAKEMKADPRWDIWVEKTKQK